MKRLALFIPLILFAGISVVLYFGLGRDPNDLPSNLIGKPVPAFNLPSLEAPNQTLTHENLLGQAYILNVWASWCSTCVVEFPVLHALKERGIKIVGLNYKDSTDDARRILKELKNPYWLNLVDADGRYAINLGVYAAPESFVVDAQGIIRHKVVGEITDAIWKTQLAPFFPEAK